MTSFSMPVPHRLVERSLRRFEAQVAQRRRGEDTRPARVITLSRQLGSGGRLVADAVAERLGWVVWDRQILDVLASESSRHVQARLFEALDEQVRGHVETVLSDLFRPVNAYTYEYLLHRAILTIAQHDAIIIGRGAHLYLPQSLRVQVVAPLAVRIRNVITFEGATEAAARQQIETSDRERAEFLQALRRHLLARSRTGVPDIEYDLQLNTGKLSVPATAALIVDAAGAVFGFHPATGASAASRRDAALPVAS